MDSLLNEWKSGTSSRDTSDGNPSVVLDRAQLVAVEVDTDERAYYRWADDGGNNLD